MHRIWIGLNPRMVVFALHTGVALIVLVLHLFAFKVVNYPAMGNVERYQAAAVK